jgi:pyruvate/2-oxoglutarate dehydrogenase complex dihydrolipoamide dehydrogenase (E3) component
MSQSIKADICVIGAGSGGLSVAAGCAQMGAKTVLIEKAEMGGDCLNYGCVPSKAMLAAGKAAQAFRSGEPFGISNSDPEINHTAVYDHVKGVIEAIAPNDSIERFEGLGVQVIQGAARFSGPKEVIVNETRISARRFVISTGSSAAVPPIPGIETVPYYTNETIFNPQRFPKHLIIIGGGPIGCELAQAHRRLGARVTVLEMFTIMPKDDPELVDVVRQSLLREGVDIREGVGVESIEKTSEGVRITIKKDNGTSTIEGSDLLVAAGRRPNLDGLNLEAGGIGYARTGITGLIEADARQKHGSGIRILRWSFHENDRAQTEHQTNGMVKVMVTPKGHILGASIVGPGAGEMIQTWVLAMSNKLKIGAVASMIAPYPTFGEASKRAAGSFYAPTLFSPRTRMIVKFLSIFG